MTAEQLEEALGRYYAHLDAAAQDFVGAAQRGAIYSYMWGTIVGLLLLALVLLMVIQVVWIAAEESVSDEQVLIAYGCVIAGGLGACASISWRVVAFSKVRVDTAATVQTLRKLGSIRPFVGGTFGLAIYFALKSGFINAGHDNFYFYAFVAFVAGFSERLIPDLVRRTEAGVAGPGRDA